MFYIIGESSYFRHRSTTVEISMFYITSQEQAEVYLSTTVEISMFYITDDVPKISANLQQ